MKRLQLAKELETQFEESHGLKKIIRVNLQRIDYENR